MRVKENINGNNVIILHRVPMSSAPQSSYHQQNQQHGMLSRQHSLHNMATMRYSKAIFNNFVLMDVEYTWIIMT